MRSNLHSPQLHNIILSIYLDEIPENHIVKVATKYVESCHLKSIFINLVLHVNIRNMFFNTAGWIEI